MPSRDCTGKRLSGAAQRRRSAPRAEEPEACAGANPFADVTPPPCAEGPTAVEAGAAQLGARALQAAQQGQDPARVRWVARAVRKLGQLRDKARHSWKACQALKEYRGIDVDLLGEERPPQAEATTAWAYYRLAQVLHAAATAPLWTEDDEAWASQVVEAAASLGYVSQAQALRELAAALRAEAEASAGAGPRT